MRRVPIPIATPEESKILTAFDAAAHDLLRVESLERNEVAPCWLVCSNEVRDEYRRKVVDWANGLGATFVPITLETAPRIFRALLPPEKVQQWRDAELSRREGRDEGDPRAFFT